MPETIENPSMARGPSARRAVNIPRALLLYRLSRLAGYAIVAAIVLFLLLPPLVVIVSAFNPTAILIFPPTGFSLRWFERALTYGDFRTGFVNSLLVAAATACIAVTIGTLLAYALERYRFRGRAVLEATISLPLIMPHFTLGLGLLIAAAQIGMQRTYLVLIVANTILVVPFVLRSVHVSLRNFDPRLALAAASLGASPTMVLLKIELPLLMPGMAGGWLLAFILTFTEFTASLMLVGRNTETLPVAMYNYIRDYSEPTLAAIAAMIIVGITCVIFFANRVLRLRKVLA
jgi:putative spermidine/putrescine transport system permease protein